MKIRSLRNMLVVFMFFFGCGGTDSGISDSQEPLTDVLTLELSFGDKDLPDEYLLASPLSMSVNDAGDIYILDEGKIKVYDSYGKEKTIFGSEGQGPGEFSGPKTIGIGNEGLISVWDQRGVNVFTNSHKYNKTINIRGVDYNSLLQDQNVGMRSTVSALAVTETKIVSNYYAQEIDSNEDFPGRHVLVFNEDDSYRMLALYSDLAFNPGFRGPYVPARQLLSFRGDFYWIVDSNNNVYFTHSRHDMVEVEGAYYHTIHRISLDNFEGTEITFPIIRTELPDSIKQILVAGAQFSPRGRAISDEIIEIVQEEQYNPALQSLFVDSGMLFIFTLDQISGRGIIVYIMSSDTGDHLLSAYFPWVPDIIKNGYAYRIISGRDIFPVIKKYKIDPKVYGK